MAMAWPARAHRCARPLPSLPVPPTIPSRIGPPEWTPSMITCSHRLEVLALPGMPLVAPGDDVPALVARALSGAGVSLADGDVLVVTSKILSRAEGRFVELPRVEPSARATELAREVNKDPRAVELILRESTAISRR